MNEKLGLSSIKKNQSNKPIITDEARRALSYLYSKIAGHSDYHGDTLLSAIQCLIQGKDIDYLWPIE